MYIKHNPNVEHLVSYSISCHCNVITVNFKVEAQISRHSKSDTDWSKG